MAGPAFHSRFTGVSRSVISHDGTRQSPPRVRISVGPARAVEHMRLANALRLA